eukprot:scaffold66932_cov20-Tisochrysis_lutea.AAC.4
MDQGLKLDVCAISHCLQSCCALDGKVTGQHHQVTGQTGIQSGLNAKASKHAIEVLAQAKCTDNALCGQVLVSRSILQVKCLPSQSGHEWLSRTVLIGLLDQVMAQFFLQDVGSKPCLIFVLCRERLSYEQFSFFLQNIKELNAGRQEQTALLCAINLQSYTPGIYQAEFGMYQFDTFPGPFRHHKAVGLEQKAVKQENGSKLAEY